MRQGVRMKGLGGLITPPATAPGVESPSAQADGFHREPTTPKEPPPYVGGFPLDSPRRGGPAGTLPLCPCFNVFHNPV